MDSLHKTCVDETGVKEALIDKLKAGEITDDDKLKCYIKCIMSESGTMDENGDIDYAALKEVLPEKHKDKVIKDMERCVKKVGNNDDHCKKAFELTKCVFETDPDDLYFP